MTCVSLMAAPPPPERGADVVAQYVGSRPNQTVKGHSGITVVGLKIIHSATTSEIKGVAIPNDEPKKGETAKPKKEVDDAVKKLKEGEYVKAGYGESTLGPTLYSIEPYDLKPGEDTKNGYVFSKTFEKGAGKTVIFTKFGVEYPFAVPTRRGEKGVMELDPDIAAAVDKLTEGSSYWVQTGPGKKLVAIEPYTDPQIGKLLKLKEKDPEGHRTLEADIEMDGGKTITVKVPSKTVGTATVFDTVVSGELRSMHANSMVEFRTHDDGGNTLLREIQAAPKNVDKKPAEAAKPDATKKEPAKKEAAAAK
ncbi:MAG TPA: hypothetical protein VG326_18300 [Tepidisphaeraceae bacterium]|nr:hypothetical protein [Tepidisphaeraceae bacterium]